MTLRFASGDLRQFAEWSADCNPLHVDADFARETHFGRPIVHGVLTALRALNTPDLDLSPDHLRALDIEFRSAAVADDAAEYRVTSTREDGDLLVSLHGPDALVLRARVQTGARELSSIDLSWVSRTPPGPLRATSSARTIEELEQGVEVLGAYPMRALDTGAGSLSPTQARVLALCSYVVGMELPGLRSLFTRLQVQFHADAATATDLRFRARTTRFDRTFRLLDTEVTVATAGGDLVAVANVRSYVPFSPASIDIDALAEHLPIGDQLQGRIALVVGGSRGLGGEIAASLALAGAQVYATGRHDAADTAWVKALSTRGASVTLLSGDAGDAAWCERTRDTLIERHGRVDVLVLNACAPPGVLRLGQDSLARHAAYVRANLPLVEVPLAIFADSLQRAHGRIACISSSYVTDSPTGFGHYVAVKQAAESLVRSVCQERPEISAVVVRPPTLQTRWNDTPAGVVSAIPSNRAAIQTVGSLLRPVQAGNVELVTEFPALAVARPAPPAAADFAVRVAATFTTDPLVPALNFWLHELEVNGVVRVAPYGQVLQSLLDPASELNARGRGINVVLLRVRDWLRELPAEQAVEIDFVRTYLQNTRREFEQSLRAHRAHTSADTLLLVCPSHGALSSAESIVVRQIESDLLAACAEIPGVQPILAADYHERYAVDEDEVYDSLRDDIAHIPYRDDYLHVLATIVARHVHRRVAPLRKVVVVDCDNTLWGGVVGEVGAEGIELTEGHLALHRALEALAGSGVLICLCSKNEESDVWRVFDTRADMALRREHVVAAMVNWLPKSQNLRTLATRLNLGLDSFVFVDDNPVECAEVRAGCPDVLTVQWPHDPERARTLLQHIWEFDPRTTTREDARRTEMYKEEFRRQELRSETLTFEDFITNLQLVVDFSPLVPEDLRRAAQLTLRTNQFNFTTIRRDEADLQALVAGGRHEIRTVRVRDRFGDYGLVGLVIAERGTETWTLDTFLLSCRVLGRGAEHRIVADLGTMALAAGAQSVKLRVETTKRNRPARVFLESVVPAELRHGDDSVLSCDMPAALLAAVRFEPTTAGELVVQEDGATGPALTADPRRLRRREEQIERCAFQLSTGSAVRAAASGRPLTIPSADAAIDRASIERVVHAAFADALRIGADQVAAVDRLETLGCDSLKIVEITVALSQQFPSLPGTLLFEHARVSDIVREIEALSGTGHGTHGVAVASAPAAAVSSPRDSQRVGDIAVVGMHLRCAGANSPDELWDLLSRGASAVKPVPENRPFFLQPLTDIRPHWAGLIDDPARFDAEVFGVAPREAEFMDPQLRLFLEVAWSALEDAGCLGEDHDENTGVFAGVMYGDYGARANLAPSAHGNAYRCWEGFSLANRLSQLLGFNGPSLAVDTACSSSGTALHLACGALNAGDCRVAVVGGVNLILDPDRFASLGRLGILSERGRCEPFGADADGTVLGEGAGVVILRPLADAVQRGDRIYGVIKGTGVSTGNGTVGFTAPNPQAQAEAIRRALAKAAVDPRTVSYVETHGTGTHLGDPIEVRGLTLGYGTRELHNPALGVELRARIGSIKPNIGHLEAGAGLLGLIKVLLQMHRGMLLPSITSPTPNPQIAFARGSFDVQTTLEPWPRSTAVVNGTAVSVPRRAGVSSFGVGGANAHVVLEEAPARPAVEDLVERPVHVLALSARSEPALARQAAGLKQYVEGAPEARPDSVCYTVNTGRKHLPHRAALAAATREELLQALDAIAAGKPLKRGSRGEVSATSGAPRVAFLFTGQGSQYAGMGRELYATQPVFRAALDRCASLFSRLLERPLLDLLFADEGTPDAELLNQTGYTQPALFAFQYALAQMWASWGIRPDIVMGHSVGEIAALCVAGGVSLEDGLRLIAARGRLMQALPAGGTMTSVMADESRVLAAIAGAEELVAIAAINAPGQVVISGDGTAVAAIAARLSADGIKTKNLTVSHAFHSPLMKPMLAEYERVVRDIHFSPPRVRFVSCVEGVAVSDEVTRPDYWLRQVMDPVRFAAGVNTLAQEQVDAFVEIGPHPVLLGMARQCVPDDSTAAWLPSMRRDETWTTLAGSVASLYTRGAPVSWRGFDMPYARTRAGVPGYEFSHKPYWLKRLPRVVDAATDLAPAAADEGAASVYEIAWREQPHTGARATDRQRCVILDRAGRIGDALVRELRAAGADATLVERFDVAAQDGDATRIVYVAPDINAADAADALNDLTRVVTQLAERPAPRPSLWVVTSSALTIDDQREPVCPAHSMLWGFGRAASLEHPEVWGALIDISTDGAALASLTRELLAASPEDQIALRGDRRYVPRLTARTLDAGRPQLRADGVYLVTGGLGALGFRSAEWLLSRGAKKLVLTGRHTDNSTEDRVATLRSRGAHVDVITADVSRATDVDRVLAHIDASGAALRGIVHAAGVDSVVPLRELTHSHIADVCAAKVIGAELLDQRTATRPLDMFVCFSSVSAVLGAQGRAHYSAANAFLDGLVDERRRRGLCGTSVNWGPWKGGGMASAAHLDTFERIGNKGLRPEQALDLLDRIVAGGVSRASVMDIDWPTFAGVYQAKRVRPLISEVASAPATTTATDVAPWVAQLRGSAPDDRLSGLQLLLRAEVAETLGFDDAASVPLDRNFYELGLDSLMMADLLGRLRQRTGVSCNAAVFNNPRVAALATALLPTLGVEETIVPLAPKEQASDASRLPVSDGTERYRADAESEILEFQSLAFPTRPRELSDARWRWMFVDSARRLNREPRFWVHRDGGRIVGQTGSIAVRLKVGEQQHDTGWLVDSMVLADHRSQAVGSRILVDAHDDQPLSLSLGQTAEVRQILYRLGWRQVGPLQIAQALVRPEQVLKGKLPTPAAWAASVGLRTANALRNALGERQPLRANPVDRFAERHDVLWADASSEVRCGVVRDASYLNWKYVDQPGQQFLRLELFDGQALRGVAVWMFRDADAVYRYRRAFLVDLVAPFGDEAVLVRVVKAAARVAADHGADALLCHHISTPLTRALRACGFHLRDPERYLLVDAGPLAGDAREALLTAEGWLVTQGDSDIDRPW